MALIKQRVGEKTFEEHRHAIIVFTDGGCSLFTSARRRTCLFSTISDLLVILSALSGVYNMGGSPLPTVQKIKNLVYINHTSEETGSQPREEYLGKGVGHHSVSSLLHINTAV